MDDRNLQFLQKCHAASGAILLGQTPSPQDLAALGHLLVRLGPAVKKLEAERRPAIRDLEPPSRLIPATCRFAPGRFFK
jgi:hypothetical protein